MRGGLAPFGVDVRLSDLYPDKYQGADGYVTSQPLDASDLGHLRCALKLAGARCNAIITNTPHNTDEACAIVRNLVAVVETEQVDFVAALFRAIWGAEPGRLPYLQPAVILRRNPLLLAASMDRRDSRKPDACLRAVRLAEGATARSIFVGSSRQARNHRDRDRAEAWRQQRRAARPFLGSDELSNEGRGAIHSSSPLAWQKLGRTRGSRHA